MKTLEEVLVEVQSLLNIETNEAKKLEGENMDKLLAICNFSPIGPIYYTRTNLIFFSLEDFQIVFSKCSKLGELLRLDMKEFFTELFIVNFSNSPELNNIIVWE